MESYDPRARYQPEGTMRGLLTSVDVRPTFSRQEQPQVPQPIKPPGTASPRRLRTSRRRGGGYRQAGGPSQADRFVDTRPPRVVGDDRPQLAAGGINAPHTPTDDRLRQAAHH